MPKLTPHQIKRLVSLTATIALVIQTIVPGGLFSWPTGRALAATNSWDFTTSSNYTVGDDITIMDGYASIDLSFGTSTDNMDNLYDAVTDVVETATAGRVLAAVATEDSFPYSTDYGDTWSVPGGSPPDSNNLHFKLTKFTSGTYSGRILAGGLNSGAGLGATWYTTDAGDTWTAASTIADTTKVTAVQTFGDTVFAGTTGVKAGDGFIYSDASNGGDGPWTPAIILGVTGINDFALSDAGTRILAGLNNSPASGKVSVAYSDDGLSWTIASTVSGDSSVTAVIAIATDPVTGDIFATTNGNYILKSTDDGATWSEIAVAGAANAKIIYVDANGGIVVIKVTVIWRSLDGGTDFSTQTAGAVGSTLAAEGFIRMSNDAYLMGIADSGGQGDACSGGYITTAVTGNGTLYAVTNNTGTAFTSISAVADEYPTTSEGTDIKYRFSVTTKSGPWYYWDGSQWSASSAQSESNQLSDITSARWSRFLTDLDLTSGTFYFQAQLGLPQTTTNSAGYDSVILDTLTITYVNEPAGGGGPPPDITKLDKEPPHSKVGWILEDNGQLTPMPEHIYKSNFTIVAQATDNVKVRSVSLFWSKSKGGNYELWGQGVAETPMPGYWAWYFDTNGADGDGTYYFYSVATDYASPDNFIEILPKSEDWQYDASTTVTTDFPYIETTSPAEGAIKVGTLSSISVKFSRDMDRASVESAFSLLNSQGVAVDLGWRFVWPYLGFGGQSQRIIIYHSTPFEGTTNYTAYINPFIAKDENGSPLSQINPSETGAYNPWHFTTDVPQKPNLSNSNKSVAIYDADTPSLLKEDAEPGDYLLYTITISNTDELIADPTTLVDNIPAHTKYVGGSLQRRIWDDWGGFWIQMAPPPRPQSEFTVAYEESNDGIDNNGRVIGNGKVVINQPIEVSFMVRIDQPLPDNTTITNTAEINDGVNPTHYKTATVIVRSGSNWSDSYKEAENTNPNRTPGSAKVGDTLIYTIYIENSGNMDALGVTVTDRVPNYTGITGTPTGGLVYDPGTNSLSSQVGIDGWTGMVPAGGSHIFTFRVTVDEQPPANIGKLTNIGYIRDGSGDYALVKEITIVGSPPTTPPYILSPTQPKGGAKSVKLFSPIVITFSDSIKPATLSYTVSNESSVIYDSSKSSDWETTWSANQEGLKDAKVTIQPNKPWQTGHYYTVRVLDAIGTNDLHLSKNGDVPNNTWGFTAARPALYFIDKSVLSLKFGTVSAKITVKLGDWINFGDSQSGGEKQYAAYQVENPTGLSIKLYSASPTGAFDTDPDGKFDGSVISVLMPQGSDTIDFYYTDSAPTDFGTDGTLPFILPSVPYSRAGYLIYSEQRFFIVTADDNGLSDQIYFQTSHQTVPAGEISAPIQFEIRNRQGEQIDIKSGRQFLLETTSGAGEFYDQFKRTISQYAAWQGEDETKIYYLLTATEKAKRVIFYYMDTEPGTYSLTVNDKEMKIAVEGDGPAASQSQTMVIVPIDDQELEEEIIEELEEVKDETNRVLDRLEINPTETTVLPNGARTFKAVGYDTEGAEIKELKFSWYVIGGGGTILKKGLRKDNHSSTFTAGQLPGVYADTVLVATLYNGEIQAAMASVTVMDVVNYGGPGELPSTGPNGIQLLFMTLTLLSAVALAAVEHYEKTHFYEEAQPR